MSPVMTASVILQIFLLLIELYLPPVYPESIRKGLVFAFTAIALGFTSFGIPLYPAAVHVSPLVVAIGLVGFALVPPFAGLIESKSRLDGQSVYSTGVLPGTTSRFPGHLLTNILSALAASAIYWVTQSTPGFDEFVSKFPHEAAFNIMLPLSMIVVFSFVRWQQVDAYPKIDEDVKNSGGEVKITGFSLRHWHQLTNVLYLIVVMFTATTTFLYLIAFIMEQAKSGQPLEISWQVIFATIVALSCLYAFGGPWSRVYRAVYLTFLTGTPAALGAAIIGFSWFRDDAIRNIAAVSIVGVGYVLYCIEVVLYSRARGEQIHLQYFSAAGTALVLAVLLGALYLS